jgi:hypothetical protein
MASEMNGSKHFPNYIFLSSLMKYLFHTAVPKSAYLHFTTFMYIYIHKNVFFYGVHQLRKHPPEKRGRVEILWDYEHKTLTHLFFLIK